MAGRNVRDENERDVRHGTGRDDGRSDGDDDSAGCDRSDHGGDGGGQDENGSRYGVERAHPYEVGEDAPMARGDVRRVPRAAGHANAEEGGRRHGTGRDDCAESDRVRGDVRPDREDQCPCEGQTDRLNDDVPNGEHRSTRWRVEGRVLDRAFVCRLGGHVDDRTHPGPDEAGNAQDHHEQSKDYGYLLQLTLLGWNLVHQTSPVLILPPHIHIPIHWAGFSVDWRRAWCPRGRQFVLSWVNGYQVVFHLLGVEWRFAEACSEKP